MVVVEVLVVVEAIVEEQSTEICGVNICDIFYRIYHGMRMPCPTCFEPGRLDIRPKLELEWKDSIWYNTKCRRWECADCMYK